MSRFLRSEWFGVGALSALLWIATFAAMGHFKGTWPNSLVFWPLRYLAAFVS